MKKIHILITLFKPQWFMNILLIIQDKDQISKEAYRIYEKLKLAQCVPLDVFGKVRYLISVSVTVTLSPFICFFLSLSFFYTPSVSLSLSPSLILFLSPCPYLFASLYLWSLYSTFHLPIYPSLIPSISFILNKFI